MILTVGSSSISSSGSWSNATAKLALLKDIFIFFDIWMSQSHQTSTKWFTFYFSVPFLSWLLFRNQNEMWEALSELDFEETFMFKNTSTDLCWPPERLFTSLHFLGRSRKPIRKSYRSWILSGVMLKILKKFEAWSVPISSWCLNLSLVFVRR